MWFFNCYYEQLDQAEEEGTHSKGRAGGRDERRAGMDAMVLHNPPLPDRELHVGTLFNTTEEKNRRPEDPRRRGDDGAAHEGG